MEERSKMELGQEITKVGDKRVLRSGSWEPLRDFGKPCLKVLC